MESEPPDEKPEGKRERKFPMLDFDTQLCTSTQPTLVIQSPKTPTLSRKLKAVSLDSEPQKDSVSLELSRDVFSMPNTPKKQIKPKLLSEFSDEGQKSCLVPCFSSNLKKFASNTSISGSQTLKTLPEVMTLQDFSDNQVVKPEPVKIKPKGLLERRGSNASLTIDLGSNLSISEQKVQPLLRLNTAKSVSNLNLSSFGTKERCLCLKKFENGKKMCERRKSQEACGNCIIYESVPTKVTICKNRCQILQQRCMCLASKCRRKSLSNENLYVPPCGFCQNGAFKDCVGSSKNCKGYRKAYYPRQPDVDVDQLLSEDFKNHLQNMQYLQTAGSVLSIEELKATCEDRRVPKLHQEFWEVPLNLQEKCYVSGSQNKNRYRGVLPNEHSRVHLPGIQTYIHANYIKGPDYTETAYIATQGPMAHTCQDFWNMIWHTNCHIIVMLTGLVEKGKNKCELYFPLGKRTDSPDVNKYYVKTSRLRDKFTFDGRQHFQENDEELVEFEAVDEIRFGNFKIRCLNEENHLEDCPLRYLELVKTFEGKDLEEGKRMIRHYWFTNWQDHKMADPKMVLEVALNVLDHCGVEKADNYKKKQSDSFTSSMSKCHTTDELQKHDIENSFDVKETSLVEKEKIDQEGNSKDSLWSSSENFGNPFSCSYSSLSKTHDKSEGQRSENPFDVRLRRTPKIMKNQRFVKSMENYAEPRKPEISNCLQSSADYRKCSSQGNSKESGRVLSTKSLENSVEFRKKQGDSSCDKRQCNALIQKDKAEDLYQVEKPKPVQSKDVNLPKDKVAISKPTLNGTFTKIHDDSHKSVQLQRRPSSENLKIPLVVHCSAGIGRTGCFLAILNGIQQLKNNLNVDVLAILCSLRLNRGGMVQTAEQYELIHRVLSLFAEVL
ncbi:hypothetical protein WA026_016788 [Henosepilachna vigintioctopunctata]|uniref:protein-tyrosine-phosphatase n=1 Tax=Henosepilachna vigintioctopunctata TaxID=420089 RepID=A0AAW1V029_9CUCU